MATHIHVHLQPKKTKDASFPSFVMFKGERYTKTGKNGKDIKTGEESAEYQLSAYMNGESKQDKRLWRMASGKLTEDSVKDASMEEAAHSAASRSQSVDPKKGWAHTQTFTVGNKKVNVDFDGRFFRSGMMRASTLEGLLALHQKAVKDASPEDLKRELQRLENRMDAFTKSAPLKEKTETAERIKEIRKLLGTKDASSVASVEKDIATQERLIAAMEKNGKGEQAGPLRSRLKFLQEELEKAKVATTDASPSEADKQLRIKRLASKFGISEAKAKAELEAEEWDEEEASVNLKASAKDSKFTGAESAWKTKVLNTHPGTFFRPHPVQSNLVRATKDGKSVGFYDTEKREGEIEEVEVRDKWPDYLDRAVSEFKQAFTRPENYTSPLAISGTIRTYNFIMAETEKIVKAARSTPEEKQKAAGLAKEFQSKYSAKLTEMDKAAAASFKARK